MRRLRYIFVSSVLIIIALLAVVWWADRWVTKSTQAQCYASIDSIPVNKVGLLLGTSKHIRKGVLNPYYQYRIEAAVALYKAGKITFILISGDNSTNYYNEPAMMRKDLITRGIPASCIFLDDAGLRTLDSILRCRDIYGEDHFTIISQPFHNERALFIADHKYIKAIAFNAQDVNEGFGFKTMLREKFARVKMLCDLLLNTQPEKFYGPKVEIK